MSRCATAEVAHRDINRVSSSRRDWGLEPGGIRTRETARLTSGRMVDSGAVLSWGLPRLRDLPWRRIRDPWRILVAEVMLQQTQVERVIPKWNAFCSAYPTPAACGAESLGEVLRLWHGLGYPRRARNLHEAAA